MSYEKKTVRSRPGLSQEEALTSLQDHPLYRPGTKVASIRRRGDRWVAELLEPKTAGELEDESGDDEGPAEAAPKKKPAFADSDGDEGGDEGPEGPDGPPDPEGGDPASGGKGGEKAEVAQLLHLVQQICDALGIQGSPDPGMGGPDDLGPGAGGPGGPPAPPHGGPPPGVGGPPGFGGGNSPQEVHHKTKLGPGEVPPGGTPLGAPSFSHVRQANPGAPMGAGGSSVSVPMPQAQGTGAPPASTGCPHGYPDSASCPQCAAQSGLGGGGGVPNSVVGRARTFVASKRTNVTLHQAKVALEAEFGSRGYYVGQIKRDDNDHGIVRALLVANGR